MTISPPTLRTDAPLVSVVTPAHDVAPWIGTAIESVRAQTQERFEHVVVDDGSADETAALVRRAAAEDPRLRLVQIEHAGSGAARNAGLAATRAPYVAFLDGDDRWHPRFLADQLAALASAPAQVGAVFCHSRVMLDSGQVVGRRRQPAGPCDLDVLLAENCPPHNGSSLLMRRSCFAEAGDFDTGLRSAVDFEMWLRIATRSTTPLFWGNRSHLVDMRMGRPGSISGNRGARFSALDRLLALYAPQMRRLHPGLAYLRPAVFAYRDGWDEIGDRWAAHALELGAGRLARSGWGRALLAWHGAGYPGRVGMRLARDTARTGVYQGVALARRVAA